MEAIIAYISSHPSAFIMGIIIIILLLLNFVFKSLIQLVLVAFFILLAVLSYYYVKDPGEMQTKVKNSFEFIGSGITEIRDKSKNLYKDSKELFNKTKEAPGSVNKLLDASEKQVEKDARK